MLGGKVSRIHDGRTNLKLVDCYYILRLVFLVLQINNPNVPSISSINDLLVKTRDSLMAGDLIKITQQLKDLSAKAVKNDLKNPKKGEIAKLNDVSYKQITLDVKFQLFYDAKWVV